MDEERGVERREDNAMKKKDEVEKKVRKRCDKSVSTVRCFVNGVISSDTYLKHTNNISIPLLRLSHSPTQTSTQSTCHIQPHTTVHLLTHISQQLSNSSYPPFTVSSIPVFQAPLSAVRINALWFTSLVFALVTASLGMLVKQWLREYMAQDSISPEKHLRI